MCFLKVYSATTSFRDYAETTSIPVFSVREKGDLRRRSTGEQYKYFCISFDVSEREWDDFPGQVEDAIAFLEKYHAELKAICGRTDVEDVCLDFPIQSRLNGEIVNQNDYLPARLVRLAGEIGAGICVSHYG